VTDNSAWIDVVARAREAFGPVDILVNNAGITGPTRGLLDLDESNFSQICDVNQTGVFLGMRAVIPSMLEKQGGSIINISSISGLIANYGTNNAAYAASKFAVRGLTKFAAIEFADKNIRVNSVHPGYTRTPMLTASLDAEQINVASQAIPAKRVCEPEEIAGLVTFLASDDAPYITGSEHIIDGGYTVV
jgi:3alpha(or 20beta)-hydroxysteroid dehydrogenase